MLYADTIFSSLVLPDVVRGIGHIGTFAIASEGKFQRTRKRRDTKNSGRP